MQPRTPCAGIGPCPVGWAFIHQELPTVVWEDSGHNLIWWEMKIWLVIPSKRTARCVKVTKVTSIIYHQCCAALLRSVTTERKVGSGQILSQMTCLTSLNSSVGEKMWECKHCVFAQLAFLMDIQSWELVLNSLHLVPSLAHIQKVTNCTWNSRFPK